MGLEPLENIEKTKGRTPWIAFVIVGILLVTVVAAGLVLYEREKPQITLTSEVARIGLSKEVALSIFDAKRGVESVSVVFIQDDKRKHLFEKKYPQSGLVFRSGPRRIEEKFTVSATELGLSDGVAEMVVTVSDYSWWNWMAGNTATMKYPVILDTRPPVVSILHSPRYIKSGSAGVVVYKISEPAEEHGVVVNDYFHPGFPLPKQGEGVYGATIGLTYDTKKLEKAYVSAIDQADNEGKAPFGMILRPTRFVKDRINISDSFLDLKLPEFTIYYPDMSGDKLERYLYVNREIRQENYKQVQEICSKSQPERLWEGRFKRMARSSRRAGFGDHRTYYYQNEEIDKQVHLGIDLASVRNAEIHAANRGVVVFADYLGIYGNTVILDHGQGIFSLYSHMSRIDTAVNDTLEKGAVLGLSGLSGMAGGDHLHFSILVNGVFVNPVEWWDEQWLELNISNYL